MVANEDIPRSRKLGSGAGKRTKYKKEDLPDWIGRHGGGRWTTVVLPTLVSYYGNLEDPWTPNDEMLITVLQFIIDTVYEDVSADTAVHRQSAIFYLVSLHLPSDRSSL